MAGVAVDDGWCILRTSPGRTLPLAAALNEAGIEAWTPKMTRYVRRPRSNVKVERDMPILPTFVFARASFVPELLNVAKARLYRFPPFSVFLYDRRVPIIADGLLNRLRAEERRGVGKAKQRVFAAGDRVQVPDGGFRGLTGVVQAGDGQWTMVLFGGSTAWKIATWKLVDDAVLADCSDVDSRTSGRAS